MAEKMMVDYAKPSITRMQSSIFWLVVQAHNFKIKPYVIQILHNNMQFNRLREEDLNAHITNFVEICDTFKTNGFSNDAIRLRLFPFTLKDKAKSWLKSLPGRSIPLVVLPSWAVSYCRSSKHLKRVYMKQGKDGKIFSRNVCIISSIAEY